MENIKKSFKLNINCANFCGFLRDPEISGKRKILSGFLLISVIYFPCFSALAELFKKPTGDTFIKNAAIVVGLGCLGLKIISLMVKSIEIRKCLSEFQELQTFEENGILKKYDENIFAFVLVFTLSQCIVGCVYATVTLIFGDGKVFITPFPMQVNNDLLYLVIIMYQLYQTLASTFFSGLIETILITILANFHAHLECLCVKIKKVETFEDLKVCIEYHNKLLDLFNSIERCFNATLFIQSTAMRIILCTLAYQLTHVSPLDNPELTLKILCFAMAMFFQIYLPYFFGSLVADKSSEIIDAVYASKWYEQDVTLRRGFSIVMAVSQRPIEMSLMGFYDMNLEKFVEVN